MIGRGGGLGRRGAKDGEGAKNGGEDGGCGGSKSVVRACGDDDDGGVRAAATVGLYTEKRAVAGGQWGPAQIVPPPANGKLRPGENGGARTPAHGGCQAGDSVQRLSEGTCGCRLHPAQTRPPTATDVSHWTRWPDMTGQGYFCSGTLLSDALHDCNWPQAEANVDYSSNY